MRHFIELFSRFSTRDKGEVDRTPVGVEFMAAVDNAIEYANGSGFDGALPEFHGEIVNRVCLSPMFCPWCVFDESLPIEQRMFQYVFSVTYLSANVSSDSYVPIQLNVTSKNIWTKSTSSWNLTIPPPAPSPPVAPTSSSVSSS